MLEFFFVYFNKYNLDYLGGLNMAYMSESGYNQLVEELRELETVQRPEIGRASCRERV